MYTRRNLPIIITLLRPSKFTKKNYNHQSAHIEVTSTVIYLSSLSNEDMNHKSTTSTTMEYHSSLGNCPTKECHCYDSGILRDISYSSFVQQQLHAKYHTSIIISKRTCHQRFFRFDLHRHN